MKNGGRLRVFLILGAGVVFVGLIVFSVVGVRYSVQGAEKSELYITERSLTHSIQREPDGRLASKSVSKGTNGAGKEGKAKDAAEPCPT